MPGPSANIPSNSRSSSFDSLSPTASTNRVGSLPDTSPAREATLVSSLGAIGAHLPTGPAWSAVSETGLILPPVNTTGFARAPSVGASRADIAIIRSAMADASLVRRSAASEGTERLLNKRELKRLQSFLSESEPSVVAEVSKIINSCSTPADAIAHGLLLRAVAARHPFSGPTSKSMVELAHFAKKLEGFSGDEMLVRATVLDLDGENNTSENDPTRFWPRRGMIRADEPRDTSANNDGLYQRFTGSCGPTVLQMLLGECDPIYAFAIHESGLTSDSTLDATADFQRLVLETYEGIALGVPEAQFRSRLRNAVGRLVLHGRIKKRDAKALRKFINNPVVLTPAAERALVAMRERYDGFPKQAEIKRYMAGAPYPKLDDGMENDGFIAVLNGLVGARTGTIYESTTPESGFARGQVWRHLDKVAKALRQGIDIPFGIDEPAHFMLITNVKGRKPNRSFLVTDPYTARTAWVHEKDFVKGTFISDVFELCEPGQRGYVDGIFLPRDLA